jgi:primosomal protein N' (replication factor Y)
VSHEDVMMSAEYAKRCADYLRSSLSFDASIIGPTTAGIVRLQNRYRYQCLIKYKIEPNLIPTFLQLMKIYRTEWIKKGIVLTIDLNPTMI